MRDRSTRRRFVIGAAGATLPAVAAPAAAEAATEDLRRDVTGAIVVALDGPRAATVLLAPDDIRVRIALAPDAEVLSGRLGSLAPDLTAFVVGEQLALRFRGPLDHQGQNVVSMAQSVVSAVTATVSAVEDARVDTSVGAFAVPRAQRGKLRRAEGPMRVTFWEDPATGVRYANALGRP